MKKKIVALLLLIPHVTYVQESDALRKQMTTFKTMITQLNDRWEYYTQCFRKTCSPQELQLRSEKVKSTTWTAVKVAAGLLLLIYIMRPQTKAFAAHLQKQWKERRNTLKVDLLKEEKERMKKI